MCMFLSQIISLKLFVRKPHVIETQPAPVRFEIPKPEIQIKNVFLFAQQLCGKAETKKQIPIIGEWNAI